MVDYGDSPTVPGYHEETLRRIEEFLLPVHRAGVTPLCLGGDHSMVLAELRAAAAVHGPLALVHLDAHADVWESYFGARHFHGTVFKRAAEEGLIDPAGVGAGRHARHALRCRRRRRAGPSSGSMRSRGSSWRRWARPQYGERVRARVGDAAGVPLVRHRLRRPRVRAGDRHARGGRARPAARRWPTCGR